MPSRKQEFDSAPLRWKRAVTALWWLALAMAAINSMFLLRRAPILHREGAIEEAVAQTAASWLSHQSTNSRVLLVRHHTDAAVWFNYRLNYLIYPRRHDTDWDRPPPDASDRYDLILAFGKVQQDFSAAWIPIEHTDTLTLWANRAHLPNKILIERQYSSRVGVFSVVRAAFSVGVVIVLGCLLLGWTTSVSPFKSRLANLAVAHLVGAAALTWIVTMSAAALHKLVAWPVYLLILLLLPRIRKSAAIILCSSDSSPARTDESVTNGVLRGPRIIFPLTVIVLALITCVVTARLFGVGWDGFSIWQFKAKAFLADGNMSVLREAHFVDYAHFDYPLLVPLQTWWLGRHAGGYSELWAQASGVLFTLDMAALFIAFAGGWVRNELVILGAAILLSLPILTAHVVSGFADIEMACYTLALCVFIARVTAANERNQGAILIWLFAGIVLIKNEGMLAAIGGLGVLTATQRRRKLGELLLCAVAVGISYMPWLALKRAWHLQNDLLQSGKNPHFTLGLVLWRIGVALRGFMRCICQTGPWAGGWGLLLLLLPVGLMCSVRRRVAICAPMWAFCAVQIVGYQLIYVITPHAIQQHINSSVDRLTLHVAPAMLLAALIGTFGESHIQQETAPGI